MRCLHTPSLYDATNETWLTTVSGGGDVDCYNLSLNGDAGVTIVSTLPPYLTFNENSLAGVIVYCLLFLMAAVGNLTVFVTLTRSRHRKSRINVMLMHLALADLMVTFIMIPLEVGWRLTVQWVAGNLACKVFLFLRAFGLYLSSNVLVCISLDRYFAVLYPLRVNDARRRGKVMLGVAWCISLVWSLPQSLVFSVRTHPKYPTFRQCVTYGFFTSSGQEVAYNLACLLAMYFVPLFVICFAYTAIMCEISKKSREGEKSNNIASNGSGSGHMRLRRSDISNIERARSRTLRLTATIVAVFVFCWTPYVVMTLWYMFDRESAMKVDARLQDALFIMAVSNSCMNPLVYGSYAMSFRRECYRFLTCSWCPTRGDTGTDVGGPDKHRTLDRKSMNGVALGAADHRTSGGTGVALRTKDLSQSDGGSKLAWRVIKNVLSFRKVGSGITRSTGTLHPVTTRNSPQLGSCGGLLSQSSNNDIIRRLPSAGQISLMSEPINGAATSYRLSFHSEPVTNCNATIYQQQQINSDSLRCSHNTIDPLTRHTIETKC